jgi:hypothetical protein
MGKWLNIRDMERDRFARRQRAGLVAPAPSADALWMHFASILPEPLPMDACMLLSFILEHDPGNLYLSDNLAGKVTLCMPPSGVGDLPLVIDNRPCGPHRCLRKRLRQWIRTKEFKDICCVVTGERP